MYATDHESSADTLSAMALHTSDAMIEMTTGGLIGGWNAAAERLYGFPSTDVIGDSLEKLLSPELSAIEMSRAARVVASRSAESFFTTRVARDGRKRHVDVTLAPIIDPERRVTGLLSIEADITDSRVLDGEALRAQRDATVGKLAAGITHEFNNVLTAIVGLADLAGRASDVPPGARESLEAIGQRAAEGTELARHLLAFGERELSGTQRVSFATVAREIEPLARRLVGERIGLVLDLADETHALEVDRAQLELVLLELITNASEAINGTGQIVLSTAEVLVRPSDAATRKGATPGLFLRATVQDSGVGMDDATSDRALDAGFTTKRDPAHSGIGLTAAAAVVRRMGGRLTLESTPALGTAVTVDLPLVAAPSEEEPAKATSPSDAAARTPDTSGNETILLVDDDKMVRDIVGRMLRKQGYTVIEACNGEDAIDEAGRFGAPIHLVLTDVMMPELNGRDLFAYLHGWYPKLRVLFMSGYTRGAIAVKDLKDGSTGFIAKPFTMDELAHEVRELLDAGR